MYGGMIMAKKKENVVRRSLYYYDLSWKYFDEKSGEYVSVKRKEEKFENFLKKFYFKEKKVNAKYISTTENIVAQLSRQKSKIFIMN